jgi:predicted amidohydrolase YtcJ
MRTLLRDGRIHSPEAPDGSALVIQDGHIAWVGDEDGAQALVEAPDAVDAVVDLAGALVTPAFVDSRVHMTDAGLQLLALDLSGAQSLREALDTLERSARASRGRPVLARGWDASRWPEGRGPSAAELDRAGYGGFTYVVHRDGQSAAASTPVLRAAGMEPMVADVVTGADLLSVAAAAKAMQLPTHREAAQRAALEAAAAAGIGSVHEFAGPADGGAADLRSLLRVASGLGGVQVLAYWAQVGGIEMALELGAIGVADSSGVGSGALGVSVQERVEHLLACAAAGVQSAFDAGTPDALGAILESFALAAERTSPISIHGATHRLERAGRIDDPAAV